LPEVQPLSTTRRALHFQKFARVFTALRYAMAVFAVMACLFVRTSVTSRYCIKTAKRRVWKTTPHDSSETPVLWCKRYRRNSDVITPNWGAKCRWGRISTNCVIRPISIRHGHPRPRRYAGGGIRGVINNFVGSRSLMITVSGLRSSWHQQGWLYESLLMTGTASHARCATVEPTATNYAGSRTKQRLPWTYPKLCWKVIRVSSKIRILPSVEH